MTSDFDDLGHIWRCVQEDKRLWNLADWLANQCVKEADTRIPEKWTFQKWLDRGDGMNRRLYGEGIEGKFEYLSDCHDVLDHDGGFHLRVFEQETALLIHEISDMIGKNPQFPDREIWDSRLKKAFKKFPDLKALMEQSGFVYDPKWKAWKFQYVTPEEKKE